MTPKLLPAKILLKRAPGAVSVRPIAKPTGQLVSSRQTVKKERSGDETVVEESASTEILLEDCDSPAHTGIAGINLGITIPGEKGSYMTARVDVFGYVPALPSNEGMKSAFERITQLCQDRLELEVEEARKALGV